MKAIHTICMMFAASLLLATTARASGPFGVTAGDPISSYPLCLEVKPDLYKCTGLPAIDPVFKDYAYFWVLAPPATGICKIIAWGPGIKRDKGEKTKKAVDDIAQYLSEKYGNSYRKLDEITPGSDFNGMNSWLMSILAGDRTYRYIWDRTSGFIPLDRVTEIVVMPGIGVEPYVTVWFAFDNFTECQKLHGAGKSETKE